MGGVKWEAEILWPCDEKLLVPAAHERISAQSRFCSPAHNVCHAYLGLAKVTRLALFSAHHRCPHFLFRARSVIIISVRLRRGLSFLHTDRVWGTKLVFHLLLLLQVRCCRPPSQPAFVLDVASDPGTSHELIQRLIEALVAANTRTR